jgi:formylglycine-generating enzyme required for sulfatase activity
MHQGSQVSRGDLLRLLQLCPELTTQRLTAPLLGFVLPTAQPLPQLTDQTGVTTGLAQEETSNEQVKTQPATGKPAPELFYALQAREQYATLESLTNDLPAAFQGVSPLQDDELKPWAPGTPLPWQPILPAPRLSEFLRKTLTLNVGRQLDVLKLVKQVARLKRLSQLPRKSKVLPAGRVVVLLDLNKRMRPFWQDAQQLCKTIERQHGRNGLDIRVLDDNPLGEHWGWFDINRQLQPWTPLRAQSVVLIISDLGQLADKENGLVGHWLRLLKQCHRQGINPVVLAPISAVQQDEALQNNALQLLWHKHSQLKPQRRNTEQETHQKAVSKVLGLVSVAAHVEPELLRAILACLPARQADSGVEAAVWLHDDINWGYTAISLKPEKRDDYQKEFKKVPAELQQQVLSLLKAQHIGQFPGVWAEEVLNAQPLVNFDLSKLADVQQAEHLMLRLTCRYYESQNDKGLGQYARRHLSRLGGGSKRTFRDYASTLYGLAHKAEIRAGAEIPRCYDSAIVHTISGEKITPQSFFLLQQGKQLCITNHHSPVNGLQTGSVLAEFIAALDSVTVTLQSEGYARQYPLALNHNRLEPSLCIPITGEALTIDTGLETLQLMPILKPTWAHSIVQTEEGLRADLTFAGQAFSLWWQSGGSQSSALFNWRAEAYTGGADVAVVDVDQYGLYAELILGSVRQRFRWVEPGTFWMGSPEDEPEREWNGMDEGKGTETRHQVTITQGFWLADTSVTQAFWRAVMGNNPSRFKNNPEHPVEHVSWHDTQLFIDCLNGLLQGLSARLPSDAEWEYVCRAGTDMPFSFGANITPEQVNYDGNYPYLGGKKGLYREKTLPVKSLPANPWGFYDMHGNVWEWCADVWQQQLSSEPVIDPLITGGDSDSARIVRGGSWDSHGRYVRSALRLRYTPDYRDRYLGFRLALGHAELPP